MSESYDDSHQAGSEPKSVTELFHRLNSVLPLDQEILSVQPDELAADALQKMQDSRFSQLPVIVGRQVLGVFSYRSFCKAVVSHSQSARENQNFNPLELTVVDCIEKLPFAHVTDEFVDWFDAIDQHNAVLVGAQDQLQGIVTAMDILRYLYGVASPFVLIGEIELALRALIHMAVDSNKLAECVKHCLKEKYNEGIPPVLEEMTFNDFVQIVGDGRNWPHFQTVMRGDRLRTRTKLAQLCELRNVIVHFKREITTEEYETIAAGRDWMLTKVRAAEARREEAKQ